jgi:hypothetical protein
VGLSGKDDDRNAISQEPTSKDNLVNIFYLRPMIGNDLLGKSEYDVEIVTWIDGSTQNNKINKMVLRPIEAGNMVELCSGKEIQLMITSGTLNTVKVWKEEKKSFMRKKQDLVLELLFYSNQQQKQQQNLSSITLNVEDKQVPEIKQYIQGIKEVEDKNYWSNIYGLPFLLEGESIIWSNLQTEGTIKKRATWLEVVTNYRILQYSLQRHAANYVSLAALEDIVVMNQRRVSQSTGYGSYGRSRYHIAGTSGSRSTGITIGDIVFISQGRPFITFNQIQDPRGLVKLVKSISK